MHREAKNPHHCHPRLPLTPSIFPIAYARTPECNLGAILAGGGVGVGTTLSEILATCSDRIEFQWLYIIVDDLARDISIHSPLLLCLQAFRPVSDFPAFA